MTGGATPPRITCVLFDLYGTLVDVRLDEDTPALWAGLTQVLQRRGAAVYQPAELRRRYLQFLADESERRESGALMEAVFGRVIEYFHAEAEVAELGRWFRQWSAESLALRSYVPPLFDALRASHCCIGIVSNTEAVLTRFDLDQFPLLHSADTIVLSSEEGVKKPDPRIMALALERLHADAATTVFVGNSLADDVEGARRAGLRAVLIDPQAPALAPMPLWADQVWRAPPTFEGLTAALAVCGWQGSGMGAEA